MYIVLICLADGLFYDFLDDYLEISVEHHDFLCGYEEIHLRAGLGLTLRCLETTAQLREIRDCFDPETEWRAVIKTWGMKTLGSGLKPVSLNRFDVETNLSNQSFTAREAGVRNGTFEEQYELLERFPHYAENIYQLDIRVKYWRVIRLICWAIPCILC